MEYDIHIRPSVTEDGKRHEPQIRLVSSQYKRIVVKAGRRGGKTFSIAIRAVERFMQGRRQLYGAPTAVQVDEFWYEVKKALKEPIDAKILRVNESKQIIERVGTKQRIKAKTCWNADSLRGDYGDDIYLDEFQLMAEDTLDDVCYPMLINNNGSLVLIFTPPSLRSSGVSKAKDPRHATKLFKKAQSDTSGRWETIHFSSHENPFISQEALIDLTQDMSLDSYRREIEAIDDDIEQSWIVYGKFNEDLCKIQRFDIPKSWPTFSGHDFGQANPAALFMSRNPGPEEPMTSKGGQIRVGDYVIWGEYMPGGGMTTFKNVENFKDILGNRKLTRAVGGNRTTEEEIREAYKMHGWPIQVSKIEKPNSQIDRVIGLMELGKIHIFDDLHNLLYQIANCLWVIDDDNVPTNKVANEPKWHLLAALRYVGSDLPVETAIPDGVLGRAFYPNLF